MTSKSKRVLSYDPKPYVVAFVDVLGFSQSINSELKRITEYFEVLDRVRGFLNATQSELSRPIEMMTIGDSVILAISVPAKTVEVLQPHLHHSLIEYLGYLCNYVAFLQAALAYEDFWTRGAITYGPLHFSEARIVGKPFHRAFSLEENVARFPRVILDGRVIEASGCKTSQELIGRPSIKGSLYDLIGGHFAEQELPRDVPTFVDFARWGNKVIDHKTWLITVSNHLSKHLREDVEHFSKYRWVADYILNHIKVDPIYGDIQDPEINEAVRLLRS